MIKGKQQYVSYAEELNTDINKSSGDIFQAIDVKQGK